MDQNFSLVAAVFEAADKYDVRSLHSLCVSIMKRSKFRICECIQLADKYDNVEILDDYFGRLTTETAVDLVLQNSVIWTNYGTATKDRLIYALGKLLESNVQSASNQQN